VLLDKVAKLAHTLLRELLLKPGRVGVPASQDHFAEFLFKKLKLAKEAWLYETEQAPELLKRVLHWRSRQNQLMLAFKALGSGVDLGFPVLNLLCLVQDDVKPLLVVVCARHKNCRINPHRLVRNN
jgi:hypothetical protein